VQIIKSLYHHIAINLIFIFLLIFAKPRLIGLLPQIFFLIGLLSITKMSNTII